MVENHLEQRTSREISNANLKPYIPGESGNPGGKPKDPGITKLQIEMMDKPCPYAKDPKTTWREWLAEKGLLQIADKPQAVKDYKDRVEGVVKDELEVTEIQKIEYIPAKEKEDATE